MSILDIFCFTEWFKTSSRLSMTFILCLYWVITCHWISFQYISRTSRRIVNFSFVTSQSNNIARLNTLQVQSGRSSRVRSRWLKLDGLVNETVLKLRTSIRTFQTRTPLCSNNWALKLPKMDGLSGWKCKTVLLRCTDRAALSSWQQTEQSKSQSSSAWMNVEGPLGLYLMKVDGPFRIKLSVTKVHFYLNVNSSVSAKLSFRSVLTKISGENYI